MSGPLEGIKVLECATWMQAPMGTAILGDLGAEVIKVEERERGDALRSPRIVGQAGLQKQIDRNFIFETINRNKRGMVLNLRKHQSREIIHKLIKETDVFVHNFRPQSAKRLGLDYETISLLNPKLVYAQASAWGLKGPDNEKGGLDFAVAARTGLMYLNGEPDIPRPQPFAMGFCDAAGAICLALGIVAAIQARERLGKGQMVDTSLLGSTVALATWPISFLLGYDVEPPQLFRVQPREPLSSYYKCSDGKWVRLVMVQGDRYWPAFCEAVGISELEKDSRFSDQLARIQHGEELIHILDQVFVTKPRAEWMKLFAERDLHCTPIQELAELVDDPQIIANDYIMAFDHPTYGRQKMVGFPYKFSETPAALKCPCPEFGQHTEEVLLELGYTWDNIADLKKEEVI